MADTLDGYKRAQEPVPDHYKRWHLRGAGLDSLTEEDVALPEIKSDQLVVRHDACGICFSDIKIINLGPEHPRLIGRDMVNDPVVMGHEVALTIVKVGSALTEQFKIGQRFIVQADVYYHGQNLAYGYVLDGGMSQYGVVGEEVLRGDEGNYLLPLEESTGYVEAALVEPWACVVAAYEYPNYRDGILDEGATLICFVSATNYRADELEGLFGPGHRPAIVETLRGLENIDLDEIVQGRTEGRGFDDILVIGVPTPEIIEQLSGALAKGGIMNLALEHALWGPVTMDIGRIHYDQRLYIGGVVAHPNEAAKAYAVNQRRDLKPGGNVWFIGAGGPMGQMHIQRTVMAEQPPKTIVVTDVNDERLARIHDRFGAKAAKRGIEIVALNAQKLSAEDYDTALKTHGPYDDIVGLVPVADLVPQTASYLAEDGVYNIFAGVARGTSTKVDLNAALAKRQRFVGTSGSSIADLRRTLELVEDDKLSTNSSLAAIGGLNAFRDGLGAVKAGAFPGKTVIFPHIENLPLMSLDQMQGQLPSVYAKLQDGKFWTKEAEEELLREKLGA